MVAVPLGPIGQKYPKMWTKIYPIITKVDSFWELILMVQRFRKLSDWPNWPVFCLYRPIAKTPVRTQNLPHKYYAPNFSQAFYECPLTLPYQDWPNWLVLLSNIRSDLGPKNPTPLSGEKFHLFQEYFKFTFIMKLSCHSQQVSLQGGLYRQKTGQFGQSGNFWHLWMN